MRRVRREEHPKDRFQTGQLAEGEVAVGTDEGGDASSDSCSEGGAPADEYGSSSNNSETTGGDRPTPQ